MFNPTAQQSDAIKANGCVLVTAAAGSGKTATLVERVATRICSGDGSASIDRMLIVTFTNNAAGEMRERLEKRLYDESVKQPDNQHIARQLLLLPSAQICTIDSFCISLVREHFEELGVAPDFKIIQGAELDVIYEKAGKATFDWFYRNQPERIVSLLSALQSNFGDGDLVEPIQKLYLYICNLAFPKDWLADCRRMYEDINKSFEFCKGRLVTDVTDKLYAARDALYDALSAIDSDPKLSAGYKQTLADACERFDKVCAAVGQALPEAAALCADFGFDPPSTKTKSEADRLAREARKSAIGAAAAYCDIFSDSDEVLRNEMSEIAPDILCWIDMTEHYYDEVFRIMVQENVLTFHNTEQLALQLLCTNEKGRYVMTENARQISAEYDEVLVDEYQDTNDMQDTLFYMLSDCGRKLFAVGDAKQSIYGFRGANPDNFVRKKQEYIPLAEAEDGDRKKIVLSSNFRSRKGICSFVNYFFSLLMSKTLGGVVYDEEEVLNSEAEFPECALPETEAHIIITDDDEQSAREQEARHIAAYIGNTVGGEAFLNDGSGGLRPAKYSDFAVLLRSPGTQGEAFLEAFCNAGIPVRFEKSGFLESREVCAMLSLLKVIDNPTRDVPLISLIMSPIFGFSADETAEIRLHKRDGSFYSALLAAEKAGNDGAAHVLADLRRYRRNTVTVPPDELLLDLCKQTGLLDSVSALPDGERRRANLLMLCEYANSYLSAGGTLGSFAEYIEKIGTDIQTPSGSSDDNCVTLVSCHKSKGLQYPVCIISGFSNRFNGDDIKKKFLISRSGVSLKLADRMGEKIIETVAHKAIKKEKTSALLSEELRLLYVAMTRAQERLVLTAVMDKTLSSVGKVCEAIENDIKDDFISAATDRRRWLLYALLRNRECGSLREYFGVRISEDKLISCPDCRIKTVIGVPDEAGQRVENTANTANRPADREELLKRMNYRYPYEALTVASAKTSVSEMVHSGTKNKFSLRPAFVSKAGLTPAQRGTATHKFMQFADYFEAAADLEGEMQRLVERGFISQQERDAINRDEVLKFFSSDLFTRMADCLALHREMRFLTEVAVSELYGTESDEKTVVQGVIDCVIEEENGLCVLDFKTDRVGQEEVLADMYGLQLEIYSKACEKIFGKPVRERLIYSFALGRAVSV